MKLSSNTATIIIQYVLTYKTLKEYNSKTEKQVSTLNFIALILLRSVAVELSFMLPPVALLTEVFVAEPTLKGLLLVVDRVFVTEHVGTIPKIVATYITNNGTCNCMAECHKLVKRRDR